MSDKPNPAPPPATPEPTAPTPGTPTATTPAPATPAPATPAPATPAPRTRRFKRRELSLAGGGKLVLTTVGSIDRMDDEDKTVQSWTLDDPEWPRWAIYFGLHDQDATIAPTGRRVAAQKPPHW